MRLEAELIGDSSQIAALRDSIRRLLAPRPDAHRLPPLLLRGETGTGKGLLARVIHRASPRREGPFVTVNCAAIPDTLIEAELFGYERGAFTDARQAKPGLFQVAHRGTIFLDEVGLLPETVQGKLLSVLEDRSVRRLGGTKPEPVDTWVIAATNEDLARAMRERRFREDLYHRLAVVSLSLPPLRERDQDVLLLAGHFLAQACADYGLPQRTLRADAKAALLGYPWPGNVRELANVIERAALLSEGPTITAAMLEIDAPAASSAGARPTRSSAPVVRGTAVATDEDDRTALVRALEATAWNVSRAAAQLGITRNQIRYRIEKYGLAPGTTPGAPNRRAPLAAPERAPAVAPVSPAAKPPQLRWERRRVTFLRAALRVAGAANTTELIEELAGKARTFGGRTEGLNATGFVAAFGLEPLEDAPRRAAHAAMAMQRAVARAGTSVASPTVAIGLHVADASIGRGGVLVEIDHDARDEAAQALDALLADGPDGIVVSPATVPFLDRRFELSAIGTEPARGYRLVGADALGAQSAARTGRFVGREHDLDLLQRRLESALGGQGQIVGITGDAGIGKSRLLLAFRERLDSRFTCIEGHCLPYTTEIPYAPIRDLVRAVCGIAETDAGDVVAAKITSTLTRLDLSREEHAPWALHLLGAEQEPSLLRAVDPQAIKGRTLAIVRQLCMRAGRETALVILVEDLHWTDGATDECLASLATVVPGARIVLVATYRPGYRPPWIDKSYATQVALQPLTRDESATIVQAVLGAAAVPADVLETILAKADGNPFFLEELARAVRDHSGRDDSLVVPDTIEEVLRARVDRLGPDDRRLLQSAAAIGNDVPAALLRSVADLTEAESQECLRRLQAAEFLYETVVGIEPQFRFKHALTREVAYGLLPDPERRRLHARIVDAIEAGAGDRRDEHVEALGYHARQGQRWESAVVNLRRAGAKAFVRSANHEAVVWFEQALEAIARLPETETRLAEAADLHFDLRNALTLLGAHERALGHLREVERLVRRTGDMRRLGRAVSFQANSLFLLGQNEDALEAGRRAHAIAEELADVALRTTTDMYIGRAYLQLGRFAQAIEIFGGIVASLTGDLLHDHLGSPSLPSVFARAHLIEALSVVGRFDDALRWAEETTTLAESDEYPHDLFWARRAVGLHHLERGEIQPAARALEQAHALCITNDMPTYVPIVASQLARAWALGGRVADAMSLIEQAVETAAARKQAASYARALLSLGEVQVLAGRPDDAAVAGARALDVCRQQRERGHEAWTLRLFGAIAASRSSADYTAAEEHYRAAAALADELGMRPLAARCELALGRVFRQTGAPARAADAFEAARAEFAAMKMLAELAVSEEERRATK